MSSRNLLNLGLLIVIAILVLLVIFEPGVNTPSTNPRLTQLSPQQVTSIRLQRQTDQQQIVLQKVNGQWQMQQPFQLPANSFRIQQLLNLLETESFAQHDLGQLDVAKFGLDKPRARVTFNDQLTIEFGNTESIQHHRYLKINNTLHLSIDTFYYQVAAKAESYIDHALLPSGSKITRLQTPNFTLLNEAGKWQLAQAQAAVTTDAMLQLITEWQNSHAYDVKNVSAPADAKQHVMITLGDGQQITFALIESNEDFVLQRDDLQLQYILANDRKDKLLNIPAHEDNPGSNPKP